MKYRLRSLMIVVTLVCVGLGVWAGRVDYLRRWSAYHSNEYRRLVKSLAVEHNVPEKRVEEFCEMFAEPSPLPKYGAAANVYRKPHPFAPAIKHRRLAKVYSQASSKPWALVDEGKP